MYTWQTWAKFHSSPSVTLVLNLSTYPKLFLFIRNYPKLSLLCELNFHLLFDYFWIFFRHISHIVQIVPNYSIPLLVHNWTLLFSPYASLLLSTRSPLATQRNSETYNAPYKITITCICYLVASFKPNSYLTILTIPVPLRIHVVHTFPTCIFTFKVILHHRIAVHMLTAYILFYTLFSSNQLCLQYHSLLCNFWIHIYKIPFLP